MLKTMGLLRCAPKIKRALLLLLIAIGLVGFIFFGLSQQQRKESVEPPPPPVLKHRAIKRKEGNGKPIILLWGKEVSGTAKLWSAHPAVQKFQRGDNLTNYIFNGMRTPEQCCGGVEISVDKDDVKSAAAVVFFHQKLESEQKPQYRASNQLWVLFGKETPQHSADLTPYNGVFNWTMNYREDSDVPVPYGDSAALETPLDEIFINGIEIDEWISKKRELITAVISHCLTSSKREVFINKLREKGNLTFDLYGACGIPTFSKYDFKCRFWEDLGQEYKFYFAAENSICSDYITEKFWGALDNGMVPVVYGGGDYKKVAPPGSFIDVRDFPSAKELADYLLMLDKDRNEYRKYFEWRKTHEIQAREGWHNWCGLCKAVKEFRKKLDAHPDQLDIYSKVHNDLGAWWKSKINRDGDACQGPLFK